MVAVGIALVIMSLTGDARSDRRAQWSLTRGGTSIALGVSLLHAVAHAGHAPVHEEPLLATGVVMTCLLACLTIAAFGGERSPIKPRREATARRLTRLTQLTQQGPTRRGHLDRLGLLLRVAYGR